MITNPNAPEEGISELLEEYFQSGYSIKDFCFIKDTVDETTLQDLIRKHFPDRPIPEDDPFLDVNIVKEDRKTPGRPKKQQTTAETASLFARIGDIELYQQVSAAYLKSLKS